MITQFLGGFMEFTSSMLVFCSFLPMLMFLVLFIPLILSRGKNFKATIFTIPQVIAALLNFIPTILFVVFFWRSDNYLVVYLFLSSASFLAMLSLINVFISHLIPARIDALKYLAVAAIFNFVGIMWLDLYLRYGDFKNWPPLPDIEVPIMFFVFFISLILYFIQVARLDIYYKNK